MRVDNRNRRLGRHQIFFMTKASTDKTSLKKVLIVEDEADMCLLLNILLNGRELELDHVKSINAARTYLEGIRPDVVLLDNRLPDGFGVDFVSYIKKNYPGVKVIMISGFDASVSDVALENGADSFLEKPFTREKLYESIKQLVN